MSFNPPGPAVGPMPGPVGAPERRSDGASLVAAIGAMAMVFTELVLLVASLLVAKSLSYLGILVGLSTNYIDAPTQFTSWDVAMTGTLVVAVFGCLTGRSWGRGVVVTAMALNAYPLLTTLINAVRTSDGRTAFTQGHNLWFNLVMVIELLIAVGTCLAVLMASASTRGGSGPAPQPAPGYAGQPMPQPMSQPMPMQGQPFPQQQQQPAPGYQPQPQPMPQQPTPGYQPQAMPQPMPQGMPPQAMPQPGPAQPGPVHQGPIQQPTPTQQADAYRPTEFSPRPPGQPGA